MKAEQKGFAAHELPEYIASLPDEYRVAMEKIRAMVMKIVPKGEELISYQIPTVKVNGLPVIAYGAFAKHCSIFTMSKDIMNALKVELEAYDKTGITVHFPPNKLPPPALVKKIIQMRMAENEVTLQARAARKLMKKKKA